MPTLLMGLVGEVLWKSAVGAPRRGANMQTLRNSYTN